MNIKVNENSVIVFDLDDTLYNEIDYLKSAYITLSKELEPQNWEQLYTRLFSLYRNKFDVFEFISNTYNIEKSELILKYRNHKPNITPFEGVTDTFKKIKANKGKIGIITDGRKATQMRKIEALQISQYLDHIVISEEIGTEKPNEKNYISFLSNFPNSEYYYIADNYKKDFITPKRLGWKTIALMDSGLNIHSNAHTYVDPLYLPHHYIASFSQIHIL